MPSLGLGLSRNTLAVGVSQGLWLVVVVRDVTVTVEVPASLSHIQLPSTYSTSRGWVGEQPARHASMPGKVSVTEVCSKRHEVRGNVLALVSY